MLAPARERGTLTTMLPADLPMPMVGPADIGRIAADLLLQPVRAETALHFVEGPRRLTPADVASAFARALGRDVVPVVVPRERWIAAHQRLGFSPAAARSYARMTAQVVDDPARPEGPTRGTTDIQAHVDALIARADDD